MYIRGQHLQELVEACAARAGLKTHIDHYFTSADHRTTKGRDLFALVSRTIGVAPQFILHAGDNKHADLDGALRSGVKGFHFNRFSGHLEDCMRKNAQLQRLLVNDHGETKPIAMSWHAIWSQLPRTNNTLEMLGWYYLGPILLHYSHWLQEQLQMLIAAGEKPRLIFMMRDGFLPHQCHQVMQSRGMVVRGVPNVMIDISRFATQAINFEVYPNPAAEQVLVAFENNSAGILNILDATGRLVYTQTFNEVGSVLLPVNVSMLSSGSYTVQLINAEQVGVKRLLIRK
jgi:hypothetical protein